MLYLLCFMTSWLKSFMRCVLRMGTYHSSVSCGACCLTSDDLVDHHCPWINNCVGHTNYANFIRFLLLVDVACSYHLAMITNRVLDSIHSRYFVSRMLPKIVFLV